MTRQTAAAEILAKFPAPFGYHANEYAELEVLEAVRKVQQGTRKPDGTRYCCAEIVENTERDPRHRDFLYIGGLELAMPFTQN